jgi:hypothetical protein
MALTSDGMYSFGPWQFRHKEIAFKALTEFENTD